MQLKQGLHFRSQLDTRRRVKGKNIHIVYINQTDRANNIYLNRRPILKQIKHQNQSTKESFRTTSVGHRQLYYNPSPERMRLLQRFNNVGSNIRQDNSRIVQLQQKISKLKRTVSQKKILSQQRYYNLQIKLANLVSQYKHQDQKLLDILGNINQHTP